MKRRYRVHVEADRGTAHVRLVRWRWSIDHITVARINLARDDAYERLSEARYKARELAGQLNALERTTLA